MPPMATGFSYSKIGLNHDQSVDLFSRLIRIWSVIIRIASLPIMAHRFARNSQVGQLQTWLLADAPSFSILGKCESFGPRFVFVFSHP